MIALHIHWRPRHINEERVRALRDALEEHPGGDPVLVKLYSETVQLGVTVDASSRTLRHKIRQAIKSAATVLVVDDADAW